MPPLFDFDTPPDRRHDHSMKWQRVANRDVIPLWVADMDFAAPPPVIAALQQALTHGVMGYSKPWPSLIDAIIEGVARDHGWHIEPDWLVFLPGVVSGFNLACQIAGDPGSAVSTLSPVYPPFFAAPSNSHRRLLRSELVLQGDQWTFALADLSARTTPDCRLFMLCNPHNPVGRSYSRAELSALGDYALRHDLLVCADEIHAGLVLNPDTPHIPFASLAPALAERTITLMAPSKTWNIAGLSSAFAIISNPAVRRRFQQAATDIIPHTNFLGLVATEAAYRDSHAWRLALLDYLRGNAQLLTDTLPQLPGLRSTPVDATYLAWLDCRALPHPKPAALFETHGVLLSDGQDFGAPGFVRLNFGCSRSLLSTALGRMATAIQQLS